MGSNRLVHSEQTSFHRSRAGRRSQHLRRQFWALQAHAPDHGWQAIPVDDRTWLGMLVGESGEWWALYYSGLETRINGKRDMADRAQMLRSHFYGMAGVPVPPHAVPQNPVITVLRANQLQWRGTAGAVAYDIERSPFRTGPWSVVCRACVDDSNNATRLTLTPSSPWYRLVAVNADGVRGEPSAAERLKP